MATTTNFGWETPDDTDLVKDGAAAMRTLGNSIDTSFVDLKGGTTGQVLSKASGTDLDFTWVAQDDSNAIQNAIVDAKGDLIAATAADTPARLAVGTNGQVLTADSTAATGLVWATPAGGALTLLSTTTLSGSSTTISAISGSYKNLFIFVKGLYGSINDAGSWMRFNGDSGSTQYAVNSIGNNRGTTRVEQTVTDRFVNFIFSNPTSNTNVAKNGTATIYIPRYTDTSATFMTANTLSGYDTNDNTSSVFYQGIYKSSAAITSITFGIYVGTFSGGTVYVYGEN